MLPLGPDGGGPLFFAHYSFLGIDPRGLRDRYADYWEQNRAHTLVNRAYCIANPKGFAGYGADCWGLTASDSIDGYVGHSPTDDRGVISPTAALSSYPYTPSESLAALRHFAALGERLWGEYGFRDAFSHSADWYCRVLPRHRSGTDRRHDREPPQRAALAPSDELPGNSARAGGARFHARRRSGPGLA